MKKRTLGVLAGLAALGIATYVGSRLSAQPTVLPPPPGQAGMAPRTRICLVNISQVIKEYKKFQNYEADNKAQAAQANAQIDVKKKAIADWQKELATNANLDPARKEQLAHAIKTTQRELEDYTTDYNQKHAKAEFDLMVQIYQEIQDAVQRYAQARDIDLVLQYNDAVNKSDFYNPALFTRKLNNGALMPMVMASGMDITRDITANLNSRIGAYPAAPTQR